MIWYPIKIIIGNGFDDWKKLWFDQWVVYFDHERDPFNGHKLFRVSNRNKITNGNEVWSCPVIKLYENREIEAILSQATGTYLKDKPSKPSNPE